MSVQVHRYTMRLEHCVKSICNLLPQPFLHSKALCKQSHKPGELGNADDMLVRDISDRGMPVKGQSVVLTEREKRDRPFNHLAQAAVWPATFRGSRSRQHSQPN